MAKRRTLVLFKPPDTGDEPGAGSSRTGGSGGTGGGMEPLGTVSTLIMSLKHFNVWPDGSGPMGFGDALGSATLYGPGFIVELPYASTGASSPDRAEITQALVYCNDDDYAWPVLSRICRANKWKLMDPDSGRTFG